MIIKREEIEKLATLSRISIDEKTITDVAERLSSVLDLVDQLKTADTASVEGISRPFQVSQRLREDEVTAAVSSLSHGLRGEQWIIYRPQNDRITGLTMHNYTIAKLIKGLQNKEFSSVELTQHFLDRISQLNSNQAAISLIEDQSIEWATTQDTNRAQGIIASPLAGIPIAIKDNINITGVKTTCGSMMLENFTSPYTATSTMKLLEAGAIPVAKANMDEFAMGSSTENSAYQTTCNPWNLETIPGGFFWRLCCGYSRSISAWGNRYRYRWLYSSASGTVRN